MRASPRRDSNVLRVAHVSFFRDFERRKPRQLLEAWPSLSRVASAAASPECNVEVMQACSYDETICVDGVDIHFIRESTPIDTLSLRLGSKLLRPYRLLERVAAFDPDVIQAAGFGNPLQVLQLRARAPQATLLIQDHAGVPTTGWRRRLDRRVLSQVDGVLFTAREQAAPFFESCLFRRDMPVFEVLEASSTFAPGDQSQAQQRSGLRGDPCLLWLARLDAVKDPLGVLDAVAMATSKLPDLRLWCCYRDAPLERQVRARIASDSRLRDRVVLLGPRSHAEVETLCQGADFLIQGSLREGSGYAVIEALACGTTPLVTDIPAMRKITKQGRFGALAAPGDTAEMARHLVEWANKDRTQLRREARRHFEDELSYEAIGRDLRAVYEAMAARR